MYANTKVKPKVKLVEMRLMCFSLVMAWGLIDKYRSLISVLEDWISIESIDDMIAAIGAAKNTPASTGGNTVIIRVIETTATKNIIARRSQNVLRFHR